MRPPSRQIDTLALLDMLAGGMGLLSVCSITVLAVIGQAVPDVLPYLAVASLSFLTGRAARYPIPPAEGSPRPGGGPQPPGGGPAASAPANAPGQGSSGG